MVSSWDVNAACQRRGRDATSLQREPGRGGLRRIYCISDISDGSNRLLIPSRLDAFQRDIKTRSGDLDSGALGSDLSPRFPPAPLSSADLFESKDSLFLSEPSAGSKQLY